MEDNECWTCGEGVGSKNECPSSKRPCGHHCNCIWIHDVCHWCGIEVTEDGDLAYVAVEPDRSDHKVPALTGEADDE